MNDNRHPFLIARDHQADPSMLDALSSHEDSYVSGYVAANPNTPLNTLLRMRQDDGAGSCVYLNPKLPPELLWDGFNAGHENFCCLSCNPKASTALLDAIARHSNTEKFDLRQVCLHPNTSLDTLLYLLRNRNTDEYMPFEILLLFRKDWNLEKCHQICQKQPELLREFAMSDKTPPEFLAQIDPDIYGSELAENPTTPATILESLYRNRNFWFAIAGNPKTPPRILSEILEKFWNNGAIEIIARNPNTSISVLWTLSQLSPTEHLGNSVKTMESLRASRYELLSSISKNPSTPEVALLNLINTDVQGDILRHPNLPDRIFSVVYEKMGIHARREISRNPRLPLEMLKKLSVDDDETCRIEIAKNPSTPPGILAVLASDLLGIRKYVAKNPNTPWDITWYLAHDLDLKVRIEATQRINEDLFKL
jgi:hypothetical protein